MTCTTKACSGTVVSRGMCRNCYTEEWRLRHPERAREISRKAAAAYRARRRRAPENRAA